MFENKRYNFLWIESNSLANYWVLTSKLEDLIQRNFPWCSRTIFYILYIWSKILHPIKNRKWRMTRPIRNVLTKLTELLKLIIIIQKIQISEKKWTLKIGLLRFEPINYRFRTFITGKPEDNTKLNFNITNLPYGFWGQMSCYFVSLIFP